jgi:hypothetical protein
MYPEGFKHKQKNKRTKGFPKESPKEFSKGTFQRKIEGKKGEQGKQEDKRTKERRDKETKGQKDKGTKVERRKEVNPPLSPFATFATFVPFGFLFLSTFQNPPS